MHKRNEECFEKRKIGFIDGGKSVPSFVFKGKIPQSSRFNRSHCCFTSHSIDHRISRFATSVKFVGAAGDLLINASILRLGMRRRAFPATKAYSVSHPWIALMQKTLMLPDCHKGRVDNMLSRARSCRSKHLLERRLSLENANTSCR